MCCAVLCWPLTLPAALVYVAAQNFWPDCSCGAEEVIMALKVIFGILFSPLILLGACCYYTTYPVAKWCISSDGWLRYVRNKCRNVIKKQSESCVISVLFLLSSISSADTYFLRSVTNHLNPAALPATSALFFAPFWNHFLPLANIL